MKRQALFPIFNPKQQKTTDVQKEIDKPSSSTSSKTEDLQISEETSEPFAHISSDSSLSSSTVQEHTLLPECWSTKQYEYFKEQYAWLDVQNRKLGCKQCSTVGHLGTEKAKHVHISFQWKNCSVVASGTTKETQQASLRKKIKEHSLSGAHLKVTKIIEEAHKNVMPSAIDIMNSKAQNTTVNIFNVVYSLVKRNRPMFDIDAALELQKKNGVDVGNCLHSRFSATRIYEHIAAQMRKILFSNIVKEEAKVCIIIDEASTVAKKSVLVIYLRCEVQCADEPLTIFVDLKELSSTTANSIFETLIGCLENYGFDKEYLARNLIAFCSDGASTMLGRHSGVAAKLTELFPNIIIWHCLNHRLQLALDDSVNDINQVNHYKIFLDKIYSIYHQSNKNQTELNEIAKDLGIEIIKMGRVLGPRWAACSVRAAKAVWRAYPALHSHFSRNSHLVGMANKMSNPKFLHDLALIVDILEEIALLSNALQARSTTFQKADKLVRRTIRALSALKDNLGCHEAQVEKLMQSDAFKHIQFQDSQSTIRLKTTGLPRNQLIQSLVDKMTARLLSTNHFKLKQVSQSQFGREDLLALFDILEPTSWKYEEILSPWLEGEKRLRQLNELIKFEIDINDFRDFVDSNVESKKIPLPPAIAKAKKIISTIAVSSAEAERGFSVMNDIAKAERSKLSVSHISSLMTIKILGKPVAEWDAVPFVKTWLRTGHREADDTRVRDKTETPPSQDQLAIWKLLD